MRIIPAKPKRSTGTGSRNAEEVVANPARLARKALVMDSDYEQAADPAIRRAERALERVRERHRGGLADAVSVLARLHAEWEAQPRLDAPRQRLYRAVHDLRGMAGDLGAPLIGRIATSLSRLMGFVASPGPALVRAHVDALRAAGRQRADQDDPVARAVAGELEARVDEMIAQEADRTA
jgi:chemotaxis protein histidine kinase CheA